MCRYVWGSEIALDGDTGGRPCIPMIGGVRRGCREEVDGRVVHARPPGSLFRSVGRFFAAVQPLPEPIQHFLLNPPHSVRADLDPLRELAGLFQPCDVLRGVQDHLLELAL